MKTLRFFWLALAVTLAVLALSAGASGEPPPADLIGLVRLHQNHLPTDVVRGIATLSAVPSEADTSALASLGLTVQPMKHLPLVLVSGTVASIDAAVHTGVANDVYQDAPIQYYDKASADAMGAATPRLKGVTGKGVTVAVVDSGCDATHPDLADHVIHNVKLYSAEYFNNPPDSSNTIVVPFEMGPYQNSDIGSGHGTHVAGIIAADGTSSPDHIGVAPDANLVCYSIGEILFTTAVVTAYDHLLDQPDLWGVKVVNNSWGNPYTQFDPRNPVNVATRAVADLGVNVFFAAGNSGDASTEMGLNPFSQAPWVTSVAAEDLTHHRASFSSNGLKFDNSQPVTIGPGGHTVFTNHRIGVYHPDVTTPGDNISSTCDTAGTVIGPCPPGENASASGTSMASPHAAGAAAVLLQANPTLTTDQVRSALQGSAAPTADGLGFWQVGYGRVDLTAAWKLVKDRARAPRRIAAAQALADKRVLAETGYKVPRSDFWTWDAPRASVLGEPDTRSLTTEVAATTTKLKITLAHPSLSTLGGNEMNYTVTVTDAAGKVVGTTTEAGAGTGTASAFIDLASAGAQPGTFTFDVKGVLAVSDPDTLDSDSDLGRVIVLQVAQLEPLV